MMVDEKHTSSEDRMTRLKIIDLTSVASFKDTVATLVNDDISQTTNLPRIFRKMDLLKIITIAK